MTRARFLPEAESELAEAVQFYERAEAGLGAAFALEAQRTVDRICAFPESGSKFSGSTRGKITANFPFWVIYRTDAGEVTIIAIAISVASRAIGGRGKMRNGSGGRPPQLVKPFCLDSMINDAVSFIRQWLVIYAVVVGTALVP